MPQWCFFKCTDKWQAGNKMCVYTARAKFLSDMESWINQLGMTEFSHQNPKGGGRSSRSQTHGEMKTKTIQRVYISNGQTFFTQPGKTQAVMRPPLSGWLCPSISTTESHVPCFSPALLRKSETDRTSEVCHPLEKWGRQHSTNVALWKH